MLWTGLGAATGISGTFPGDLEVGTFVLSSGLLPLLVFYGSDPNGTVVGHYSVLPFLSGALAPQIHSRAPTTENLTLFFSVPSSLAYTYFPPE